MYGPPRHTPIQSEAELQRERAELKAWRKRKVETLAARRREEEAVFQGPDAFYEQTMFAIHCAETREATGEDDAGRRGEAC